MIHFRGRLAAKPHDDFSQRILSLNHQYRRKSSGRSVRYVHGDTLMQNDQQDSLPYSIELHQKDNSKYLDSSLVM